MLHPPYHKEMVITNDKKTGYIAFRVTEVMERQFSEKHPENTTKSMILRELLRMYLENEIRVTKIL